MTKKGIVAFSLFGDKDIYIQGLKENLKLIPEVYPDCEVIVYVDDTVPKDVIVYLGSENIHIFNMRKQNHIPGEFWRFKAYDIHGAYYYLFRDCDSRVSKREASAVQEWLESGKNIHVMRDHPYHKIPLGAGGKGILAGMWGVRANTFNIPMYNMLDKFVSNNNMKWGSDQTFLYEIYQKYKDQCFEHDPFHGGRDFPIKRENYHFVGERINADGSRFNDYKIIEQYENRLRNSINK